MTSVPTCRPPCIGDPGRLRQIVTNLVGNAIKFTEHGEVVLTVEPRRKPPATPFCGSACRTPASACRRNSREAIFKPFIQADGSTTRKYGGTGLGLAISTNLVALLGGRIWLESETGRAARSTSPCRSIFSRRRRAEARTRDAQMMRLRDMPVLVVDDNAVNRRILEATLRRGS